MNFYQLLLENTGDLLKQALVENPQQTDRWLVYADYLDDNNQDKDAELIRFLLNSTQLYYFKLKAILGIDPESYSWKALLRHIKSKFSFIYNNLIMKNYFLRSVMEIDRKNFRGKMVPFYQNGFYIDDRGITWEAFSPRNNSMSSWVRLERPNHKAYCMYDPGHHLRRTINKGREYIPGVHSKAEATGSWDKFR